MKKNGPFGILDAPSAIALPLVISYSSRSPTHPYPRHGVLTVKCWGPESIARHLATRRREVLSLRIGSRVGS